MRPFRFGVTHSSIGTPQRWTSTSRRAEQLGYATVLLPDATGVPAPLPALAAAAGATTTLHVGTWVLCEPLYERRHLLRELSGAVAACGDRFEIGIGAGRPGAERDAAALGVPFGSPAERVERLAATVTAIRDQLAGATLLVAASGPRLLALAGRSADVVALGWAPDTGADGARRRVAIVREAAAGRDVELATGLVAVGDSDAPWLDRAGLSVRGLTEAGAVTVVTGTPQRMADTLRRRRDDLGLSYVTVPATALETFAPVVELLAGT